MSGRSRAGLRAVVVGLGLMATLAACSDISETLWPSMSGPDPRGTQSAAAAPAPAAATAPAPRPGALTVPPPAGPIQTDVGQRARQLREEAQRLLNSVLARGNTIQQIRGQAVQHAQAYQGSVGAINARLAVGTTAGNPVLQQQWGQANQQLDLISGDVSRLSGLTGEIGSDSNVAQGALQQVSRTFSLPGAVEDDHRFLVNAEDDINRAIVLNNRQLGEVNSDMTRLSTYVSRERPTLTQLSQAIAAGQLLPGSQLGAASRSAIEESRTQPRSFSGGVSSAPLRAPARATAPSAPSRSSASRSSAADRPAVASSGADRRPLVTIRFDRPNPAYEQPLYTAVSRALERRPSAMFDLVAVAPSRGRQSANATARARTEAQQVLRTLTDMGLPANRVSVSSVTSAALDSNEVRLYVR